ncbi:hypothetical protein CUMW_139460 [Citrus unshiu]|uniref:Uncharacterized protein n=1 Tax=Citrus unshiu TaxID=55188 RepID=A0A2H5PIE3_CITUN|nr:hypothetical protein CUMW_139460 [Citrus unshiu]
MVVNSDGVEPETGLLLKNAFSTVWDPVREAVVYNQLADPNFASESSEVDINLYQRLMMLTELAPLRKVATNGKNNAFPSFHRW